MLLKTDSKVLHGSSRTEKSVQAVSIRLCVHKSLLNPFYVKEIAMQPCRCTNAKPNSKNVPDFNRTAKLAVLSHGTANGSFHRRMWKIKHQGQQAWITCEVIIFCFLSITIQHYLATVRGNSDGEWAFLKSSWRENRPQADTEYLSTAATMWQSLIKQ